MDYPKTRTTDHVDDRFGMQIPDPYRWLEDLDAPETAAWVREQNALARRVLDGIPARPALRARLAELVDHEKWSAPVTVAGRSFALWNDGARAQPVLCMLRGEGEPPQVLVDPNAWSADGTTAITAFVPSPDGSRVAYGVAEAGSDWNVWRVLDVDARELTGDTIERMRFSSPAWSRDGRHLYHAAFEGERSRVWRHEMGLPQSRDVVVYERADRPSFRFQPQTTEDGARLVIYVFDQTGGPNAIACIDLATGATAELPDAFAGRFAFCGNEGSTFWFMTDLDAPRGRIVSIDVADLRGGWREIVPQADETLLWVTMKGDRLLSGYLADGRAIVRRYGLDGSFEGTAPLPGIGWAGGFGGERDEPRTHFVFTTFTRPPVLCRYDADANESAIVPTRMPRFDADAYGSTLHFVTSKDGARIPLFVTGARDLARDGDRPALMWGYGGFGIPVAPWYWPVAIAWIERGGVFAMPCLRGGGEYGEEWHRAGSGPNKQNTFDDFISCAEWLIAEGFTRPERLAIAGGSNGGLLVGACITQRPDLFAAAHIDMGVLDMMAIDRARVGLNMRAEYGDLGDPNDVKRLLSYSPLHNVRPGTRYPRVIVTTGDHDELVVPSNSYKFAATMQAAQAGDRPVVLRVDMDAGHGVGKPTAKVVEEQSDVLAFLLEGVGGP